MFIFIELGGEAAEQTLSALRDDLGQCGEVKAVRLLKSLKQPGLCLLLCESSSLPSFARPEGARVWQFLEA